MAFTESYCVSGGSNLFGGSDTSTTATFSATNKAWVSTTGVYTTTGSNLSAITVGQFASVFLDAATVGVFVGRVTAVDDALDTITVSTTAKSGTAPTTSATGISINVGGGFKGPNAAEGFPFNFAAAAMTNAAGDPVRINFKNNTTYAITAAMTHTLLGPVTFQGMTTTAGDGGRATIDGTIVGASYKLLTISGNGAAGTFLEDLVFANNGTTGSAAGVDTSGDRRMLMRRCVVHDVRGEGITNGGMLIECETYACNTSNTANLGGVVMIANATIIRHFSHDNTGSNNNGIYTQLTGGTIINSVLDSNGLCGLLDNSTTGSVALFGVDFYNNGADGFRHISSATTFYMENCNFVKNGGFGFNISSGSVYEAKLVNCGFGSGTQANSSGQTNGARINQIGNITYASGVTPWVDPANGDFRINLAAAKGAGRGAFTQTQASYAGTVGYPDIGSAQHLETATVGAGVGIKTGGRL